MVYGMYGLYKDIGTFVVKHCEYVRYDREKLHFLDCRHHRQSVHPRNASEK
jgi:hypothetical protein